MGGGGGGRAVCYLLEKSAAETLAIIQNIGFPHINPDRISGCSIAILAKALAGDIPRQEMEDYILEMPNPDARDFVPVINKFEGPRIANTDNMSVTLNPMAKMFLPAEVSNSKHLDGTPDRDPKAEFPNARNVVASNVISQMAGSRIPGNVFVPSKMNSGESYEENYSALNATLNMQMVLTTTLPAVDSEENHACVLTACDDSRDELLLNEEGSPNNTLRFQKYTSGEFIEKRI